MHPILELGASVCWAYTVYIYFNNQSFINHDNVLIPCTNNFDQTRSLYYYKCKWTYHVRKSTASKRTPHASHSNHPECSVGRGELYHIKLIFPVALCHLTLNNAIFASKKILEWTIMTKLNVEILVVLPRGYYKERFLPYLFTDSSFVTRM